MKMQTFIIFTKHQNVQANYYSTNYFNVQKNTLHYKRATDKLICMKQKY